MSIAESDITQYKSKRPASKHHKDMMMIGLSTKPLTLALFALLICLQYQVWCGQGGLQHLWRLRESIAIADIQNAELIERNETLVADVRNLRSGDEAVNERARMQLGMVAQDETFYQIAR